MDNPAVSAPAVSGRIPDQQVDIGTEIKADSPTSSAASEPVPVVTQAPTKNDQGWRRVVRNFSPSCESLDRAGRPHDSPPRAATTLTLSYRVCNNDGHRSRCSNLFYHSMGC